MIVKSNRIFLPVVAGLLGASLLIGLYYGIVSWAESPQHAAELFWQDRGIILPMTMGFGVQVGLYTILKKRLFVGSGLSATAGTSSSGMLTGAGGTTSAAAMVACCAHHVTDVLPILGLTAAATFLAQYRAALMFIGLGMTLFGIGFMLVVIHKERQKVLEMTQIHLESPTV